MCQHIRTSPLQFIGQDLSVPWDSISGSKSVKKEVHVNKFTSIELGGSASTDFNISKNTNLYQFIHVCTWFLTWFIWTNLGEIFEMLHQAQLPYAALRLSVCLIPLPHSKVQKTYQSQVPSKTTWRDSSFCLWPMHDLARCRMFLSNFEVSNVS